MKIAIDIDDEIERRFSIATLEYFTKRLVEEFEKQGFLTVESIEISYNKKIKDLSIQVRILSTEGYFRPLEIFRRVFIMTKVVRHTHKTAIEYLATTFNLKEINRLHELKL